MTRLNGNGLGHGRAPHPHGGLPDPFVLNAVNEMVCNSFFARSQFLDKYIDGRRDIDAECNYPTGEFLPIDVYRALYAREGVAERVVNVWPKECWQVQPKIYENNDAETSETPFETAWNALSQTILGGSVPSFYDASDQDGGDTIWSYLYRADVLSGIGTFGVLLLGLDDGKLLEEPADGVPPDGDPNAGQKTNGNPNAVPHSGAPFSQSSPSAPARSPTSPDSEPLEAPQITNPSQAGPTVPGSEPNPFAPNPDSSADPQPQPDDLLSKSIYGQETQEQKLSSTMGTDAQYFGTQFTPTSFDDGQMEMPIQRDWKDLESSSGGDERSGEYPPSDEFAPGSPGEPTRQLLYLRVFDESLVQVVQYEADIRNPRFGQPLMYLITLNDPNQPHTGVGLPLATVRVHWSRVIHIADNLCNSEIFGVPRMQPVLNRLLDLRKLYSGSAEGYWKGALPILSLETNPQLGGDVVIDQLQMQTMMTSIMNSLQRYMMLTGMTAKTIAPQVADPTPQIAAQIEAICIQLTIPVRVFKGSERGELASSQDDSQWNDRLRHRQSIYLTPRLIAPFVDRLIAVGVLPKPKQYHIEWPDLDSQTDAQKATILLQKSQAYAAYVSGNVESILPPVDYMTRLDNLSPDEAQAVLDDAQQKQEEEQQQAQALADQHGFVPQPPEGFTHPPQPPDGDSDSNSNAPPNAGKATNPAPPMNGNGSDNDSSNDPTENAMRSATAIGQSYFAPGASATGRVLVFHGGAGSGDFGHPGRPGERGGSEPGQGGPKGAAPSSGAETGASTSGHAGKEGTSPAHGEGHAAGHGEHEHQHSPVGSIGMETLHEASHVHEIVHALPKVLAAFGKTEAGKAATGEGIEHGINALHQHAHEAAAHAALQHGAEGAASGEAGAHGEHGGHGEGHNPLGAFAEATGAILGAKVGEHLEKKLGIEEKTKELYQKMKEQHGELAPWLHAAATATSIAIKTTLAHAIAGPLGAVAQGAMGHLGEHILEAATEGLSGFGGFVVPGVTYAALLATHALGSLLDKTGITDTRLAHKAGQLQKHVRESRVMHGATALIHGAEQHVKNLTSLRLLKEGKLAGRHALGAGRAALATVKTMGKAGASATKGLWDRLHVQPAQETSPSYLGGPHMALPTVTGNAATATGKLPTDLTNNPAVEMVIQTIRHAIQAIQKTPLWDKLNTPQGRQLVQGLVT